MRIINKRHSIYTQLLWLLVFSALIAVVFFGVIERLTETGIDHYLDNSDYIETQNKKHVNKLQEYIDKNNLFSTDSSSLKKWVSSQNILSIQIYKDDIKVFDSDYPDQEIWEAEIAAGYYDWEDYYFINFSDGGAYVVITGMYSYYLYSFARNIELVLAFLLFLSLVLLGIRRKMKYIIKLSKEIGILEGGQLDYAITIQGKDELSYLAESLDGMRRSFQKLIQQEAEMTRENQRIVTEMSHDIRTPITTILLYTEILKHELEQSEQKIQFKNYIEKIDEKARRLKQLTDHLFEYSLTAGEREVQLEEAESYESIFFDLFSETCNYLNQQGFAVDFQAKWGEEKLRISSDYLMRIMDNITSNIIKYADPSAPIVISARKESEKMIVSFENKVGIVDSETESTGIGLQNIKNMMQKMNGECRTRKQDERFVIEIVFPVCE